MVRFHRQLLTATTTTTCLFFCVSSDSSADFPAPAVSLRGARDRNDYFSWHWVIGYIQCKCVFYFWLCNAILCDTWHSFDYLLGLHVLFDGSWFCDYMSVHPDSAIWLQGINLDDKSVTSISNYFIKKRLWKTLDSWDETVLPRKATPSIVSPNACNEVCLSSSDKSPHVSC